MTRKAHAQSARPKAADRVKSDRMTPAEQLAAFQKAARELGTDDDPERFKERVRKVATRKPEPIIKGANASPKPEPNAT